MKDKIFQGVETKFAKQIMMITHEESYDEFFERMEESLISLLTYIIELDDPKTFYDGVMSLYNICTNVKSKKDVGLLFDTKLLQDS